MTKKVKIAAAADLHVKEGQLQPYRALFEEVSAAADVLVIAGDLTDLGKPKEAEILAKDLHSCSIPVVAVLGNHDHECDCVEEVSTILKEAGVCLLEGGRAAEYAGVSFAGTKGFAGGFGRYMLGSFGEAAIKAMVSETIDEAMCLENAIRSAESKKIFVVLHYAPILGTVTGEPKEIYPFLGSSRLAEIIDRFPVTAVVHGHAHHGTYEGKTSAGVPVYNVAAHIPKPTGRPYALIEL